MLFEYLQGIFHTKEHLIVESPICSLKWYSLDTSVLLLQWELEHMHTLLSLYWLNTFANRDSPPQSLLSEWQVPQSGRDAQWWWYGFSLWLTWYKVVVRKSLKLSCAALLAMMCFQHLLLGVRDWQGLKKLASFLPWMWNCGLKEKGKIPGPIFSWFLNLGALSQSCFLSLTYLTWLLWG